MSRPRCCTIFCGALLVSTLWTARAEAAGCTISTSGVAFGAYDVFNSSPVDSTGNITYACNQNNADIVITLGKGGAALFADRRMLNASEILLYNLYTNAARTIIWGDGTESTQTFAHTNMNKDEVYNATVYGRVPATQDVAAGSYSNTIVATIIW